MSASQVSKSSVAQGNPKGSKAWDQTSSTAFAAELLLVGGGGGGQSDPYGGGGGGGQYQDLNISVKLAQTYPIVIGPGGPADTVGSSSTAFGYTSVGGGTSNNRNGATSGNGYTGGVGSFCPGCCAAGGGGGGSTGYGGSPGHCNGTGNGGPGANWKSLGTVYAAGARGMTNGAGYVAGAANTGNGGGGYNPGGSGIVIIRYTGSAKATGGTITSSGGYTYHTFTSNGNLVT